MKVFEMLVAIGYFIGVFLLLPLLIYTTMKEKIFNAEDTEMIEVAEHMDEDQRNNIARQILVKIEGKMDRFVGDDGVDYVTINNGSQAKYVKYGLDYIYKKLNPTDPDVISGVNYLTRIYNIRTKRYFTGSYLLLIIATGFGVYLWTSPGSIIFNTIHTLGIVLYFLASRTTAYTLEQRVNKFRISPNIITSILSGIFIGKGVKHYMKEGDGPWTRDWDSEFESGMDFVFIAFIGIILLAFLTAFIGVLSFILNYSTSFLHPFYDEDAWVQQEIDRIEA